MRFFFLGSILCLFTLIGILIQSHYKSRKRFFDDLISFCNHLSVEINFSKNTVAQIIDRYSDSYAKHFDEVIKNYANLQTANADITYDTIQSFMWRRLKKHESSVISDFFYELGRHGVSEETQKLENGLVRFDRFLVDSTSDMTRKASIYMKLSIILGIGVVVLIW